MDSAATPLHATLRRRVHAFRENGLSIAGIRSTMVDENGDPLLSDRQIAELLQQEDSLPGQTARARASATHSLPPSPAMSPAVDQPRKPRTPLQPLPRPATVALRRDSLSSSSVQPPTSPKDQELELAILTKKLELAKYELALADRQLALKQIDR